MALYEGAVVLGAHGPCPRVPDRKAANAPWTQRQREPCPARGQPSAHLRPCAGLEGEPVPCTAQSEHGGAISTVATHTCSA